MLLVTTTSTCRSHKTDLLVFKLAVAETWNDPLHNFSILSYSISPSLFSLRIKFNLGIRLAELNNFQQLKVRQLQIWPINTSQLGDNCLFRNCLVNGKHHPLNSDFFARIYHQSSSLSDTNGNTTSTGGGVNLNVRRIEFDFVSAIRPAALVSKSFKFIHSENLDTTGKYCSTSPMLWDILLLFCN